jgi:hypothetical protein
MSSTRSGSTRNATAALLQVPGGNGAETEMETETVEGTVEGTGTGVDRPRHPKE